VTDFLDEKRTEIADRLVELKPFVDEYQRLEAAVQALDGVNGSSSSSRSAARTATTRRRGPGRPRGSGRATAARAASSTTTTPGTRRRAGRRKGSGTRAAQTLTFVTEQPGITIPELAAKMGIKQNYLYRVLPGLEQEGKVSKQGRGWHATAAAA
jgi:hypothetical protein